MKCPTCGASTRVTDSRYYPLDAKVRTKLTKVEGQRRIDQPRQRWLDIPAAVRPLMPKGSTWRKRRCSEGHVHHTFETGVQL